MVLATLSVTALPRLSAPADASPRVSGKTVATEVRHSTPAKRGGKLERLGGGAPATPASGQAGADTLAYTSEVLDARQRFDYVGVHWQAARGAEESMFLEVRTSADGAAWSEWEARFEEEDMRDLDRNELYSAPLRVGDARYAQYRVWFTDGDADAARAVALTFMDVSDLNASPLQRLGNDLRGAWHDFQRSFEAQAATRAPVVRTRADWVADESIVDWIPEYKPWQKAVVHHTVTRSSYADAETDDEIRAIYHFHAVTRGWTDIGYNFIVDRFGRIWQGRQGGDDTAGGHAFGWNYGSFGVAALGDFSTAQPTPEMLNGIANIIAMEFTQRGIQPLGADPFTHREKDSAGNWVDVTDSPPNVLGHRDCTFEIGKPGGQTACPGGALYGQLQTIRQSAQNLVNDGYTTLVHFTSSLPHRAPSGKTLSVPVTVKNVGRTTIVAGGANATRLSYQLLSATTGQLVLAQGPLTALPGDIAPGGSRTFPATVNVPAAGRYILRWDLHATGQGWFSAVHGSQVRDEWLDSRDWDAIWTPAATPGAMVVGRATTVNVTVRNNGSQTWPAANVRLSYHWVDDATGTTVVWDGQRGQLPSDVATDQEVTVPISVLAPSTPGLYWLEYDLVYEGQFWFSWKGVPTLNKVITVPFDYRATYTAPTSLTLVNAQETTVPVSVRNDGTTLWPASGGAVVRLGTHWYTATGTLVQWDGERTALPQDLSPGQTVNLQAKVRAPVQAGSYRLETELVLEGVSWFSWQGTAPARSSVTVRELSYGARYEATALGAQSAWTQLTVPMTLTNTGERTWSPPNYKLSYHLYDSANRTVVWDGLRTDLPGTVAPGQSVTVQAKLRTPATGGNYTVKWDLLEEGVAWFSWKGVPPLAQALSVASPVYRAAYDSGRVPATLPPGTTAAVPVTVRNDSNFAFNAATGVFLSYHWYDAAGNRVVWDGKRTALDLAPGQTATVSAEVLTPAAPGTYRLAFDLVQEGLTWFSWKGVPVSTRTVSVAPAEYWATYSSPGPQSAPAGQTHQVPLTLTNTGTRTWSNTEVFLSYHLYRGGAVYVWDGARTALPGPVAPGQTVTVNANVSVPLTAGTYDLRFDLVHEGLTWFSWRGVLMPATTLTAQ